MSSIRLGGERGFTLIELLVAMVTGLVVVGAAFTILEVSLRQSVRIADRVSADQRGRVGLEKILQELHSSCVSNGVNPIMSESKQTKLVFQSHSGSSEPYFTNGVKHEIYLEGTTLYDKVYESTSGIETHWNWPSAANKTVVLLTNVYEPTGGLSMFEYFKYTGTSLTSAVAVPLTATTAKAVAKVNVNLSVAPETNNTATGRPATYSGGAVLRLTPASEVGGNEPCE